jgi:hypothetical protein
MKSFFVRYRSVHLTYKLNDDEFTGRWRIMRVDEEREPRLQIEIKDPGDNEVRFVDESSLHTVEIMTYN